MFERILVPLDGSAASEAAIPHARALAGAFGSELALIRVVRPGRAGGIQHDAVEWRLDLAETESYLQAWAARLAHDDVGTVRADVAEGSPAEEIVRSVRQNGADLIVIATHGLHGATDFHLGSTAQKVISTAGASVLLVRPTTSVPPGDVEAIVYRRIMVPVDGSPRSDWALCLAASLARAHRAELFMVHVVPIPEVIHRTPLEPRYAKLREEVVAASRRAAERFLKEMRAKLATPELEIRSRILESARIPRALHELTAELDPDLVIVSAHGVSGAAQWPYGSVVSNLIAYGQAPLLVFQDQPVAASSTRPPRLEQGRRDRRPENGPRTVPPLPGPRRRQPSGRWLYGTDRRR